MTPPEGAGPASFSGLRFDNSFVRELPADVGGGRASRQVEHAAFSRVVAEPVRAPRLVALSREVASALGLSPEDCASEAFARIFAGNELLPGMDPFAAAYGGHQFGNWAGQLGDGRAITLGEVLGPGGVRLELQLKGAGRTPYSRSADGRAVLRSSVREFVCSEAMHHLGIPTTRALSLVSTGDSVMRDMFYDGRAKAEPGAIVCRVAPSFLRFGNFELPASRKDVALLRTLLDYTLRTHFADLGTSGPDAYAAWLAEVARRTATLMAEWMRVGFVHGVMNTDNMSVLGLTLDYGPFGMLDHFDPDFTPNTTDAGQRRYRFANQPRVARWNLFKLGEALAPLLGSVEPIERALELYTDTFESEQRRVLAAKLGLAPFRAEGPESADDPASDAAFIDALFTLLSAVETDFTLFFRNLANVPLARLPELDSATLLAPLQAAYYDPEAA